MRHIRKIELLLIREGHLLVVRKRGGTLWILPGGKPNEGEDDETALRREVLEELGCHVSWSRPYTECTAPAADLEGVTVTVSCHLGEIAGRPQPGDEIEEIRWIDIHSPDVPLAISIEEEMIPLLRTDFTD